MSDVYVRNEVNTSQAFAGIGFCGLLTITLLVLKVIGYDQISWWLVFLPLYWWAALGILIALVWLACWILLRSWRAFKSWNSKFLMAPKKKL